MATTPRTYTYTWTQTRLETIQDQFRYFMMFGGINSDYIDKIVYAVGEKAIETVALYAYEPSGLRVIEVQLTVDWKLSAELSLTIPTLKGGLSGWDDRTAPEVKVAGRRFQEAAERLQLKINSWIRFVRAIHDDEGDHERWKERLGLGGKVPDWKEPPQMRRTDTLLDLSEVSVSILGAGGS
jgi:hypothetical protein